MFYTSRNKIRNPVYDDIHLLLLSFIQTIKWRFVRPL